MKNKLNTSDILVILFATIIFFGAAFSTVKNLNLLTNPVPKVTSGQIIFANGIAQRKHSERMSWENLKTGTPLTWLDSIRTGKNSEVILKTNDNSIIDVEENSALILLPHKDRFRLNIQKGSFFINRTRVDSAGIVSLFLYGTTLSFSNASFRIMQDVDGNYLITPIEGDIEIAINTKSQLLHPGNNALIENGKITITKQKVRLISPMDNNRSHINRNKKFIEFSWKKSNNLANYSIEIADNQQFENSFSSEETAENRLNIAIPTGTYFWRINTIEPIKNDSSPVVNNEEENYKTYSSEIRKFSIIQNSPPQIFSPENNSQFFYKKKLPHVHFYWKNPTNSLSNKIEISTDKDFSRIFIFRELKGNSISISMREGKYFWRIISKNDFPFNYTHSEIRSFQITKILHLHPPLLNWPPNNKTITNFKTNNKEILFNWKGNPEFSEYLIMISRDKSFKHVILEKTVPYNFYPFSTKESNESFFWKVIGKSENSKNIESEIRKFNISDDTTKSSTN